MTHMVVATFTSSQYRILFALAARDGVTVERWVEQAAVAASESDSGEPRAPIRNAAAKAPCGITTTLVVCGFCKLQTRPVATCDNCERPLP